MKKLILILAIAAICVEAIANTKSINPDKVEYNLFDISTGYKKNNEYSVKGISFNHFREEYTHNGASFKVDKDTFENAKAWSQAVLRATPGDSFSHFGTAFHVGGNLVFTNQHVLSVSRKNTTQCKHFRVKLNENQKNKTLKCKAVHFCHKSSDFCLIEMSPHKKGYALNNQRPVTLKRTPVFSDETYVMSIGNTRGFGLHAATGFGLENYGNVFKFFAPVFGGNSGGAIFNRHGEVIGVVRAQSKKLYGEDSYNVAISLEHIYIMLKEVLKDKPEILNQINFIN